MGCFDWRASKVESLISAIVSSEHASQMATLKSPSSNFPETLAANMMMGSWCLRDFLGFDVEGGKIGGSVLHSTVC